MSGSLEETVLPVMGRCRGKPLHQLLSSKFHHHAVSFFHTMRRALFAHPWNEGSPAALRLSLPGTHHQSMSDVSSQHILMTCKYGMNNFSDLWHSKYINREMQIETLMLNLLTCTASDCLTGQNLLVCAMLKRLLFLPWHLDTTETPPEVGQPNKKNHSFPDINNANVSEVYLRTLG